MSSLFNQFAERYKAGLQAQPEWVRHLHTAPSNLVADIVSLPALPADLAMLVGALSGSEGAMRLSETLSPGWVQATRNAGDEIRGAATELAGVEPAIQVDPTDGTLKINKTALLLQEGPGALIPVGTAAKAGQTATKTGKALQVAKELALPGAQSLKGAPLSIAATVGAPIAVDAALEATGTSLVPEQLDDPLNAPLEDPLAMDKAVAATTPTKLDDPLLADPLNDPEFQDREDGWSLKNTIVTGLGAAAGVAGLAVAGQVRNTARAARKEASSILTGTAERLEDVPRTTQQTDINDLTGPITDTKTVGAIQLANRYAALENALEKTNAPDADLFRAELTTTGSNDALGSRTKHFFTTGQLPNSKVRSIQLGNHMNQLGRLTPEQQALYDDALLAGTKIDQMVKEQNNVWGNQTYQSLDAIRQRALSDPKLKPLLEESRKMYSDAVKYAVERGYMSQEYATKLRIQNPNFVPTRMGREIVDDSPGVQGMNNLFQARGDLAEGVQPGELVPPSKMHTAYMSRLIRQVELNGLRRNFIDQMTAPGSKRYMTNGNQPVFEKVAKPMTDRTITIMRNGNEEHWVVRDNGIYSALQFTPNAAPRIGNWLAKARSMAARGVVEGSTGIANPFFAPTSAWYDVASTFPTTPKGRALGPLDELLMRFSDGKVRLGNYDFSALASPITGTMKSYNAKAKLAFSNALDASLRNDGFLKQVIGDQEVTRLRDVMLRAYENSSYGIHQRFGGGSFGALDAIHDTNADDILKAIAPEYVQGTDRNMWNLMQTNPVSRAYVNALNTIKASNRMQFTGSNIRRNAQGIATGSDEELMKIVADSRRIGGGDLGVRGGDPNTAAGRAWQQYLSEVPYLNTAVQEPRALINAIKKNKWAVVGTAMTMGGASLAAMVEQLQDPDFKQWYVNELTPQQRARMLPAQLIPGTRQPVAAAQVTPLMRPIWSMIIESYLTLGGYKNPVDPTAEGYQQSLAQAVLNSWGPAKDIALSDVAMNPIPPWAQAGLSGYAAVTSIGDPEQDTFALNELGGQRFNQTTVFDKEDPAVLRNLERMLDNIIGGASQTVVEAIHAANISQQNNASIAKTMDNAAEAMTDRFKQPTSAGLGSSLWGTDIRLSNSGAISEAFHTKTRNADAIAAAFNSGVLAPGMTNMSEGRPLVQGGQNLMGTEIDRYGMAAKELNKLLEDEVMKDYRALRKEIDAMQKRPGYIKPDAKHPTRNKYIASMKELEVRALEIIDEIEELYNVDFSKGVRELSATEAQP